MSIVSYVVETELALKALKDERDLLRTNLRDLETRNQLQLGAIKRFKQERQEEETRRAHAEFRLRLALANIELLRREQGKSAQGQGGEIGDGKKEEQQSLVNMEMPEEGDHENGEVQFVDNELEVTTSANRDSSTSTASL